MSQYPPEQTDPGKMMGAALLIVWCTISSVYTIAYMLGYA